MKCGPEKMPQGQEKHIAISREVLRARAKM